MTKTTRVSYSRKGHCVNVTLPERWAELTDDELRMVFKCMASMPWVQCVFDIFHFLTGCKVVSEEDERGMFKISFPIGKVKRYCWVSPEVMAEHVTALNFLLDPGFVPVRLNRLGDFEAVDAQLHGVTFKQYINFENFFQTYLRTQNAGLLAKIAAIFYPGFKSSTGLEDFEVLNILTWSSQIKRNFSKRFPNFFRPAVEGDPASQPSQMDVMNNQIRALTGGDVTKEEEVFAIDCWRALTELDAKAKEAEDFKRQTAKNRH